MARRPTPVWWCIWWDPFGLACFVFGISVVLLVDYVTVARVLWPWFGFSVWGVLHATVFQTMIVLILASYLMASMTNPGAVDLNSADAADARPRDDDPDRAFKLPRRFCTKCKCWKPPRAHHCSTCGRCIVKMDHHCPWVNNCVGTNNLRFFLQFLLHTFVGATYAALLALTRLALIYRSCGGAAAFGLAAGGFPGGARGGQRFPHALPRGGGGPIAPWCTQGPPAGALDVALCIVSTVLAVFFSIFTAAMAFDQVEGMTTGTTAIESMQGWAEEERTLLTGLADYCGAPPGLGWLLPMRLPPSSPAFFSGAVTDPDDYDPRDPATARHFARVEAALHAGRPLADDGANGGAAAAVHAGPGGGKRDAAAQAGPRAGARPPAPQQLRPAPAALPARRRASSAASSGSSGSSSSSSQSSSRASGDGGGGAVSTPHSAAARGPSYVVDEGEEGREAAAMPGCARPPHGHPRDGDGDGGDGALGGAGGGGSDAAADADDGVAAVAAAPAALRSRKGRPRRD